MKERIAVISVKKAYNCYCSTDLHFYKILSRNDIVERDRRDLSYDQIKAGLKLNTLVNEFDKKIIYNDIEQNNEVALLYIQNIFAQEESKYREEVVNVLKGLGFILDKYWEIPIVKKMLDEKKVERELKRKKEGFIIYKENYKEMKPEEYQGGFTDTLFSNEILQKYVKGVPFGYIGSSERKIKYDKKLEKQFMKLKPKVECNMYDVLSTWLTSSSGRHFADNLETQPMNIKQMKRLWNEAWIFMKEEHKGTWDSSEELTKKYKDELFQ